MYLYASQGSGSFLRAHWFKFLVLFNIDEVVGDKRRMDLCILSLSVKEMEM